MVGLGNTIPGAAIRHAMADALDVAVPSDVAGIALDFTVAMTVCVGAGDEAEEEEDSRRQLHSVWRVCLV